MPEAVELPAAVPVMPLPGVLLFPNALLPLHIFEPRFREMLARALDDNRMLCVALNGGPARTFSPSALSASFAPALDEATEHPT